LFCSQIFLQNGKNVEKYRYFNSKITRKAKKKHEKNTNFKPNNNGKLSSSKNLKSFLDEILKIAF